MVDGTPLVGFTWRPMVAQAKYVVRQVAYKQPHAMTAHWHGSLVYVGICPQPCVLYDGMSLGGLCQSLEPTPVPL